MSRYIDIHTHRPTLRHLEPQAVGIHPWEAKKEPFDSTIFDGATVIGEIGLDFACNVDRNIQELIFRTQLAEAERRKLPVILHCVRAFEPMMKILAEYSLYAVIFHGFIGSMQQAQRVVDKGYYLSFGPNSFRSPKTMEALRNTPLDRLFAETDDSAEAIENVYLKISQEIGIGVEDLQAAIENNYRNIFTNNHDE